MRLESIVKASLLVPILFLGSQNANTQTKFVKQEYTQSDSSWIPIDILKKMSDLADYGVDFISIQYPLATQGITPDMLKALKNKTGFDIITQENDYKRSTVLSEVVAIGKLIDSEKEEMPGCFGYVSSFVIDQAIKIPDTLKGKTLKILSTYKLGPNAKKILIMAQHAHVDMFTHTNHFKNYSREYLVTTTDPIIIDDQENVRPLFYRHEKWQEEKYPIGQFLDKFILPYILYQK